MIWRLLHPPPTPKLKVQIAWLQVYAYGYILHFPTENFMVSFKAALRFSCWETLELDSRLRLF
jgi:hypothetical protein